MPDEEGATHTETSIALAARSSTGGAYRVVVTLDGKRFSVTCTCKASAMGNLCKHRVRLLAGDVKILADTSQLADMQRVAELAREYGVAQVCQEIADAEDEIVKVQTKIRKLRSIILERIT